MNKTMTDYEYVLVGGGLQNGLMAMALLSRFETSPRIAIVEKEPALGGNHTWCFHADDVGHEAKAFVAPLVTYRWSGYRVVFPRLDRHLDAPYAAVTSERFAEVVGAQMAAAPGCDVLTGVAAVEIEKNHVRLADGRVLTAKLVIDARGPDRAAIDSSTSGFQKFVGLEIQTRGAHGVHHPLLMDAKVEQRDGFRFVYVLPLSADRLLVEDTRFSDTANLDMRAQTDAVYEYIRDRGFELADVIRTESGVLPLPWHGNVIPRARGPLVAGYQGGWFHPVTGYSFPLAVRLADYVAKTPIDEIFGSPLKRLENEQYKQIKYGFRLNKMLFNWFPPEQRYNVLERFYTMPSSLIRRFYAMTLTAGDRSRILMGRPPRGLSYKAALLGRRAV